MIPPASQSKVMILGDTRDLHHHGCEAVFRQLLLGLENIGITPTQVIAGMNWSSHAKEFLEADLVVINGEGSLHHDRPIVHSILEIAERRKKLSLPTALINSSWFANSPAATSRLNAFNLIAMRDPLSRSEIKSLGLTCLDAPDLAIREACSFPQSPIIKKNNTIIISDSTRPEITKQLRLLGQHRNWKYLPILYPPTTSRPGKKSRKIFKKIKLARALGPLAKYLMSPRYHAHLLGAPDLPSYMNALRESNGVLTGRFHTACLCIGLGIPFIAIESNTNKIQSLLIDAGLNPEQRVIPPSSLDTIHHIPPFTLEEIDSLTNFRLESEIRFNKLFTAIRNLLPANP